jgi:hypothetical protein
MLVTALIGGKSTRPQNGAQLAFGPTGRTTSATEPRPPEHKNSREKDQYLCQESRSCEHGADHRDPDNPHDEGNLTVSFREPAAGSIPRAMAG